MKTAGPTGNKTSPLGLEGGSLFDDHSGSLLLDQTQLVVAAIVGLWGIPANGASQIPEEVYLAAQKGISFFKAKVGPHAEKYGFKDIDQVDRVTLGRGFRLHYIGPERLATGRTESLLDLVDPVDAWEYTVDVDGSPQAFLTIGLEDEVYRVVHFGGDATNFGKTYDNFERFVTARSAKTVPTLVKAGPVYYFVGVVANEEVVLPALSEANASQANGMDNTELRSASEVVRYLREQLRGSVEVELGGIGSTTARPHDFNILALSLGLGLSLAAGAFLISRRHSHH